mmetsp:Transcript_67419/g.119672  ORF Transcript_67419/g.119672 Transcript_67419/m.119672 type:complete len:467 (+) Transcript_67419:88-1488(+)
MAAGGKQLISALSNLSIQYNFACITIALAFMDNTSSDSKAVPPAYPRTDIQSALLKSLVFAGAITGQLTMGYAGDALGRRWAMLLTNCFSIVGALSTALLTWGSNIYIIMGIGRFLLGVGVGGKYPLAATMSQESEQGGENRSLEVAKGFFWQSPGAMLPYAVGMLLLTVFGHEKHGANYLLATSIQFRLLLGIGAVPTIITTVLTYHSKESAEYEEARAANSMGTNPLRIAWAHPELWGRLAGCGISWFLYDFVFYGTSFNQVDITDRVFGNGNSLWNNCWQNVVLSAVGVPGVASAVSLLMCWSSRKLQIAGFAATVLGCGLLALAVWLNASITVKFLLFCLLLFVLNWGINVSTYTLPAECFPTNVRSTFFGLSAAMGKVGALIGSATFAWITDEVGLDGVYLVCAAGSFVGVLITLALIPDKTFSARIVERIPRGNGSEHGTSLNQPALLDSTGKASRESLL